MNNSRFHREANPAHFGICMITVCILFLLLFKLLWLHISVKMDFQVPNKVKTHSEVASGGQKNKTTKHSALLG